jgi:nicotinamidase-related amidase
MTTCLIVIDAQESFRHRSYFIQRDLPGYLNAQNRLIQGFIERDLPIVQVLHADGPARADNPFAHVSGHVVPLSELQAYEPAARFVKERHSALVGTGLDVWLIRHGIRRLVISGIRTEQCCETTTRHASDLGFEVDYVIDATLTFDMIQPDGRPLGAADIKARTATVLAGRFATLCSVDEAIARAEATSVIASA